jgi:hypothetical protein
MPTPDQPPPAEGFAARVAADIVRLVSGRNPLPGRILTGDTTVGELILELLKYDPRLPVKCSHYESHMTDAGTDLGDNVERNIDSVHDLETRVVIET